MLRKTICQPDNGSIFRKIPYAAVALFLLLAASPAAPGEFQVGTEAEGASALEACSRNGQADTIHLTSSIKLTAPHPFTAENHPLEILGNGQCIDGSGLARCLDIKDMKNPLSNAHLAICNVCFLNGAAPAAGSLLINYRTPGNNSDVNIHACTSEKNHAVLWEHGWGGGAGGAKIEASGSGAISVTGNFFGYNTAAFWYGGVLVHLPLERFDPRLLPPCSEVFEYSSRTPTRRKLYMPPLSSTILRERGWGLILSVEPSPMGK